MLTVYSRKNCVQCNATYRKLDQLGLTYAIVNMDEASAAVRDKLLSMGFQQAPVVKGPYGEYFSGYQPDRLEEIARELES